MATTLKRMFALLAIYAIALQGVLAGPAMLAHALSAGPAAVTCHSGDGSDTAPPQPAHAGHDHCALCGATVAGDVPTITSPGTPLARPTDMPVPDEPAASVVRNVSPQLARAPPRPV